MKRIRQNFGTSVGLNFAFLAAGLTGRLTPALGALLHNGTTIGVCLNAMRDPKASTLNNSGEDLSEVFRTGFRYVSQILTTQEGVQRGQ